MNQEKRGSETLRVYSRRKVKLVNYDEVAASSDLLVTEGIFGGDIEEPGETHAGKNIRYKQEVNFFLVCKNFVVSNRLSVGPRSSFP